METSGNRPRRFRQVSKFCISTKKIFFLLMKTFGNLLETAAAGFRRFPEVSGGFRRFLEVSG